MKRISKCMSVFQLGSNIILLLINIMCFYLFIPLYKFIAWILFKYIYLLI